MIVSRDLDCTNTLYIQFSFKFITKGHTQLSVCSCYSCIYDEQIVFFVRLLS